LITQCLACVVQTQFSITLPPRAHGAMLDMSSMTAL